MSKVWFITGTSKGFGRIWAEAALGRGDNAFPTLGLHHASKRGLEAFSRSLAAEVKPFGINVTIVEPTGYTTDWAGPSSVHAEEPPLRTFFGAGTLDMIRAEYESRLENWEDWDGLATAAHGGVAR